MSSSLDGSPDEVIELHPPMFEYKNAYKVFDLFPLTDVLAGVCTADLNSCADFV